MENKIIEIDKLRKSYGKSEILHKLDFTLEEGEVYGLIGRNGAGKTTFMKLIVGLIKPISGKIKFNHCSNEDIGALIENPGLFMNLSAYDNMKIKAILVGANRGEIEELLELVGLGNHKKTKVSKFSFGMRQRLSIALAILGNPKLLLLDEPINGLDPQGISEIRKLITKINKERKITILISSHILSELGLICSRFGFIDSGNFLMDISREDLELECCKQIIISDSENDGEVDVYLNENNIVYRRSENEIKIYLRESDNESELFFLLNNLHMNKVKIVEKKTLEAYYFEITENRREC